MTLKIFVADDSATIQKIVTLSFGGEDAIVRCVSDGAEALDAIRDFRPDVVLADIFMPGFNGYEICERIKEDAHLASIPVILLTGTFEAFDEQEASRVKCDGHLTKPFDTSELIETVHSLAEKSAKAQNDEQFVETPGMNMRINAVSSPESPLGMHGQISARVWDSFLGSNRILDLFNESTIQEAEWMRTAQDRAAASSGKAVGPISTKGELSEDAVNLIVERVMQRMSADIIREVAWDVVPELSENIIRCTIEERKKS